MYTVLPALQTPTGLLSVPATLGPKVSTGASAPTVLIASLKVTATENVAPAPESASLISKSDATTLTTVGFTRSIATVSWPLTPRLPAASAKPAPVTDTEPVPAKPSVAVKMAL